MCCSDFSAFFFDMLYTVYKDKSRFYEIRSLDICKNVKAFNWVNRRQLIILKTFLKYMEFCIVAS